MSLTNRTGGRESRRRLPPLAPLPLALDQAADLVRSQLIPIAQETIRELGPKIRADVKLVQPPVDGGRGERETAEHEPLRPALLRVPHLRDIGRAPGGLYGTNPPDAPRSSRFASHVLLIVILQRGQELVVVEEKGRR
jgi:hypothetical protein